jgi:glycosyltransferase involved in cell wall biosynthesis
MDLNMGGIVRKLLNLIENNNNDNVRNLIITYDNSKHLYTNQKNKEKFFFFVKKNSIVDLVKTLIHIKKLYKINIIHSHGLWDLFNSLIIKFFSFTSIPYLISPDGMLEPWSLSQKKIKKKIAMHIYQKKIIQKAKFIIVSSELEKQNILKLNINNNVKVIPIGIKLPQIDFREIQKKRKSIYKKNKKKYLLFISRLHEKKGLNLLIKSWSEILEKKNWQLILIGDGNLEYTKALKNLALKLKVGDSVKFLGSIYDDNLKSKYYQSSSFFILPTYSENFGLVILEALSNFLPVATTNNTPWSEITNYKCGVYFELNSTNLSNTIKFIINLNNIELDRLSYNSRILSEKYNIKKIVNLYNNFYLNSNFET